MNQTYQVPKIIIAPGFTETKRHFNSLETQNPGTYDAYDSTRDYREHPVQESRAIQLGQIAAEMDPLVIVAHSLSTGASLQAATKAKVDNPNRKVQVILDKPIGTQGQTPVAKLVVSATIKTFRNLIAATRTPYGEASGNALESRRKRFKKVMKDMGAAASYLARLSPTFKEIHYASQYDIHEDLKNAVNAGVDVHLLLANKDDMDNTNNVKNWGNTLAPSSLLDENGELLVAVSTEAYKRASHDSTLYAFNLANNKFTNILGPNNNAFIHNQENQADEEDKVA